MTTVALRFGPPPSPALLAPASAVLERLQITAATPAEQGEALRLAASYTAAFEEAAGRPLLRRAGVDLDFAVDCEGGVAYAARRGAWLIDLDFAAPVESVASVRLDDDAASAFDIDFDSAAALDASDYRLADADGQVLLIRDSVTLPAPEAGAAVRVRLTCGYEARSDAQGWTPTQGARAMPADLEEAWLEQTALAWRRRSAPHLRYEGKPTGAGSATSGFAPSTLAPKAIEILRRYATWAHALALQSASPQSTGGAGA